jgi:hypothetical protein
MQLYSQFLYNLNTGMAVVVVPLVIGVVGLLVGAIGKCSGVKKVGRYALREYTFVGLMFTGSIAGGAVVLELRWGMGEMESTLGMLSLVAAAALLALYPLYLILRVRITQCFPEYKAILKNNKFSMGFHLAYFLLGLAEGALLCAYGTYPLINCAAAALPFTLFLIALLKPVFKKQLDHYRTLLNLLTLTFLQVPFLYANFSPNLDYASESDLSVMMPLFLAVLLFINFLANLTWFVYLLVKRVREAIGKGEGEKVLE